VSDARDLVAQEWGLTVPLDPKYKVIIQRAAAQDLDKMAGYARKTLLRDLQRRGLLNEQFEPIEDLELPSE
jgi:hypothetical protein